jgi:TldD protein
MMRQSASLAGLFLPQKIRGASGPQNPDQSVFGEHWRSAMSYLLGMARAAGADFADIFLERSEVRQLATQDSTISQADSSLILGAGVRVARGLTTSLVSTTDITTKGLEEALGKALKAAGCKDLRQCTWLQELELEPLKDYALLKRKDTWHSENASSKDTADLLLRWNTKLQKRLGKVESTMTSGMIHWQEVMVANTDGVFARDIRLTQFARSDALVVDGAYRFNARDSMGSTGIPHWILNIDLETVLNQAEQSTKDMLRADFVEAGQYPVLIGNGFGGVILHESCGHLLETNSLIRGISPFKDMREQQIAHSAVTAWDEGHSANLYGSLDMDDEGMPAQATLLIENGILRNFMIDRLGSSRLNLPRTGSGRRQNFRYAPTARMRNTYFAAGEASSDEMIAAVGDGLYCKTMGGGSVDSSGQFNFSVRDAWEIKNGKLTRPLKGAVLIGSGADVLKKISLVGRDLDLGPGHCGSISGTIYTTCGQPHIKVDSITVGGR